MFWTFRVGVAARDDDGPGDVALYLSGDAALPATEFGRAGDCAIAAAAAASSPNERQLG